MWEHILRDAINDKTWELTKKGNYLTLSQNTPQNFLSKLLNRARERHIKESCLK